MEFKGQEQAQYLRPNGSKARAFVIQPMKPAIAKGCNGTTAIGP
jgi:hypothetical protein